MAKRLGAVLLAVAVGCGGGGGGVPAPAGLQALPQELIDCLRDRTIDLFNLLAAVSSLFDAAVSDRLPDDVLRFERTGDNREYYDFTLRVDLDGDGAADATVTGQFRVADGSFAPFSSFELDWTLEADDNSLAGDGSLVFVLLGENRFEMTGVAEVRNLVDGCRVEHKFSETRPFDIVLPLSVALRRAAANAGGASFFGDTEATFSLNGDTAVAELGFAAGTQTVTGTNITLNEELGIQPFVFTLPGATDRPPAIDAAALLACATEPLDLLRTLLRTAIQIAQGTPPPRDQFSYGPSMERGDPPFTFVFEASAGQGATVSGKATFSEDPLDGVAPGDSVDITASFVNRTGTIGEAALTGRFGTLLLPEVWGELLFEFDGCSTTFRAARDSPVTVFGTDIRGDMTATVRTRPGVGLDLNVSFQSGTDVVITGQTTNGDPVPRTVIENFER